MGNSARDKGNAYERLLANKYKSVGFLDCVTSRSESKRTDDKGIDLCYTEPFIVQAKCYKTFGIAQTIATINEMDDDGTHIKVCHVKISRKDGPKNRKGSVVVLLEEDRMEILKMLKGNDII